MTSSLLEDVYHASLEKAQRELLSPCSETERTFPSDLVH